MRTSYVAFGVLAMIGAGACKRDFIAIPAGPQELVLHGVLNPSDTMQVVLIERTLTGTVTTPLGDAIVRVDRLRESVEWRDERRRGARAPRCGWCGP